MGLLKKMIFAMAISTTSVFAQGIETKIFEDGQEYIDIGDMKIIVSSDGPLAVPKKGVSRWKRGRLPIDFAANVPSSDQQKIIDLCNKWGDFSVVECFRMTNESSYIQVTYSTESNSVVGRKGGKQILNIARTSEGAKSNASDGTIIHEFGHALGFRHQHTSPDRDFYIKILTQNMIDTDSARAQFDKDDSDRRIGPYDYESIMHYKANQASKNGNPVIMTIDPSKQNVIGQRIKISDGDALGVAFLYGQDNTDTLVAKVPDYVNLYRQPYFYNSEYSFPEFGVRTRVTKGGDSSGSWQSDRSCEMIIFSHDVTKQSIPAGTLVKINTVVELETELYRRTVSVPPRNGQSCP